MIEVDLVLRLLNGNWTRCHVSRGGVIIFGSLEMTCLHRERSLAYQSDELR